jgi:ketosteroid isomerase-like protein
MNAYEAWNEAFNRGDAGAVAALYAENARLLPPTHEVIEGRQAIGAFWDGLLKIGVTDHRLELITAEGDQRGAVGAAKWSARGKGDDGSKQTFGGSVLHVFERQQDGGLKLWLHT